MKHFYPLTVCLLSLSLSAAPLRFAVLTDTHIGAPEIVYDSIMVRDTISQRDTVQLLPREVPSEPMQVLALCTEDMKSQQIDFLLHAGDMTENGDSLSLVWVRNMLDSLELPYYITSGNHETTWSRSALQDLRTVFDSVRYAQNINDMLFLGLNSGPIMRMSDGHIAPADTLWLRQWLDSLGTQPTFIVTHYPVQNGDVDNWYDLTNILREYNTQVILSGHYHQNKHLIVDSIDNVLCRSSLPDKENNIGYTVVEVNSDSIRFCERSIAITRDTTIVPALIIAGEAITKPWLSLPLSRRKFGEPDTTLLPSYAVNDSDSLVIREWSRQLPVSFYATPTERYGRIYIGDDNGTFYAFDMSNGRILWRYKTNRRIVGSSDMKDGRVVFASANGTVYCLSVDNGKLLWRQKLGKPITGSWQPFRNNLFLLWLRIFALSLFPCIFRDCSPGKRMVY